MRRGERQTIENPGFGHSRCAFHSHEFARGQPAVAGQEKVDFGGFDRRHFVLTQGFGAGDDGFVPRVEHGGLQPLAPVRRAVGQQHDSGQD
jgi:hypothetical protein